MLFFPQVPNRTILAKSKKRFGIPPKRYPKGWRHELQSLSIVKENNVGDDLVDSDLFHHLIASHHGWARNFTPLIVENGTFQPFELDELKSSSSYVEEIFDKSVFLNLNKKYGYWGLAFLESLLRLADWRAE
jgi:CRISPR-associated endonuclease/helicase Cas3